jgi:transcriptional regulator with XRE-family HTH domain
MTGEQLRRARINAGRSQIQASADLGVSQTYLSLLEKGLRYLTPTVAKKAARVFRLPPTAIPLVADLWKVPPARNEQLAADLAALGYPGLAHIKPGRSRNPAEVIIAALRADNLETRLVEALPWVVLQYETMDWKALTFAAKANDIQNRLGYTVNVARHLAATRGRERLAKFLELKGSELENSRLAKEDTLCNDSMTDAEKRWLRENRSAAAKHWRLLTDLTAKTIDYAD